MLSFARAAGEAKGGTKPGMRSIALAVGQGLEVSVYEP
jgi:uncharacterized Ntn-hydrolase superfamily protein